MPSKKKSIKASPKKSLESAAAGPTVSVTSIPPLRAYNPFCRGAFNILRHRTQPAEIPKLELEKGVAATSKVLPGDSTADNYAKKLKEDPWQDFDLWKAEYNQQVSLMDMKAMTNMIQQQERSYNKVEQAASSSDTQEAAPKKK